ncbi:hypothetical protein B0H13DRAFT_1719727, partial [Mycena leptocephala]
MARVPLPWPSPGEIRNLVEKSSGYFIYASTVIKFIDDKDCRPTERLDLIIGIALSQSPEDESPYEALDQLYMQILCQTHPATRPRLVEILTVILSDLNLRVRHIEQLLELKPGDVRLALRGLHSLLYISDNDRITFHHASFPDFLNKPTRSGPFYVGGKERANLASRILRALAYTHEDSCLNRQGHVAWRLASFRDSNGLPVLTYVASVPPSKDLLVLLQSLNPSFLFDGFNFRENRLQGVDAILAWIKESP